MSALEEARRRWGTTGAPTPPSAPPPSIDASDLRERLARLEGMGAVLTIVASIFGVLIVATLTVALWGFTFLNANNVADHASLRADIAAVGSQIDGLPEKLDARLLSLVSTISAAQLVVRERDAEVQPPAP